MKTYNLWALVVVLLAGCGSGGAEGMPVSCQKCGDGAIVCTGSVQDCVDDNAGACTTEIGATGSATLTLNADGNYSETSAEGTQTGTWTEERVGSGNAILLHTSSGPTALLSVYPAGACPY